MSDLANPNWKIGPLRSAVAANRVFLAPMSGVSDLPFRQRAWRHGAGLVVSEMIASEEYLQDRRESRSAGAGRRPAGQHAATRRPRGEWMDEAARIAEGEGADIIDINMGCPAKKGDRRIFRLGADARPRSCHDADRGDGECREVPVTLKMRLGWDEDSDQCAGTGKRAVDAGVRMVTVHGRTRDATLQWTGRLGAASREVREAISMPLVVNGDIAGLDDAKRACAASGADAVMIGRGSYGQPWLPAQIAREGRLSKRRAHRAGTPGICRLRNRALRGHADALRRERSALRHARKHLGWYLDRHAVGAGCGTFAANHDKQSTRRGNSLISHVLAESPSQEAEAA
jgi:tRNA-dihydrouridine synthase B